ncbi:YkgJ family cysteine cluster protein [Vibrio mangrovi]|uniref:YkgJ family cysteine cluster protein n=1 Tax=Vibrio mangrovi TaxID=474394 RepID=A0ABU4I765_9VIBR|nr:YkgJ family cysteine cluster protein [Vibrio mangrovi]MDW6003522.1 YkgJ family cysteine cluster protein [Vibrio mangrovi]
MLIHSFDVSDWSPCVSQKLNKGCGACCIAPSISSPLPGMPEGKPAGVRCVNLDSNNLCKLFGQPDRPEVCLKFTHDNWICGSGPAHALMLLTELELNT